MPTASTLSDVLPEVARLIGLPQTGRPWEFTTAAGSPLNPHAPLHEMRLRDGQVLCLRPQETVAPPVVRDAAESLAATAANHRTRSGIDVIASAAGVLSAGVLVAAHTTPLAGVGAAALLALVVAVSAKSRPIYLLGALACGAGVGAWVAGSEAELWPLNPSTALGVLVGVATIAALIGGGAAIGMIGPRGGATILTAGVLLAAGALGAWLPAQHAPAALITLGALAVVMLTPAVATRAAGLRIPRVPTAGQEFAVADDYQDDVDDRSAIARSVSDGLCLGTAVCVVPSLAVLAINGGVWVLSLGLCVAGALIVHASRHHSTVPRLSLALTAMAAVTAAVTSAASLPHPHPALIVIAAFTALAAATATVWASRVPDLEPTTLVWLERAEAVAIIAVIPLAVHLTGLFELIRGL